MCGESSIEGTHSPFPTRYLKVAISYHAVRVRKKDGYGPSNEENDKLNSPRKACRRRKRTQNTSDFVILFLPLEFCTTQKKSSLTIKRKQSRLYRRLFPAFFFLLLNTVYSNLDFLIYTLPCQNGFWSFGHKESGRIEFFSSYFWNTKKWKLLSRNVSKNILFPFLIGAHITAVPMLSQKPPQIHFVSSSSFIAMYSLPSIRPGTVQTFYKYSNISLKEEKEEREGKRLNTDWLVGGLLLYNKKLYKTSKKAVFSQGMHSQEFIFL